MLIETKLRLAFVWQSHFCPKGVCGQLQKSWFRVLFCFTAENSSYFLTTRFIHTRDCTSQAEILGFRSDCIVPMSLCPPPVPRIFWTSPPPQRKGPSFTTPARALALHHSCRLHFTPMLLKWIQWRWVVKIFRWSCGILRLSFVVPAKTVREASLNRDGYLHSKFPGITGGWVCFGFVSSMLFFFFSKVFPVLRHPLPLLIAFLSTPRFYQGGRISSGPLFNPPAQPIQSLSEPHAYLNDERNEAGVF